MQHSRISHNVHWYSSSMTGTLYWAGLRHALGAMKAKGLKPESARLQRKSLQFQQAPLFCMKQMNSSVVFNILILNKVGIGGRAQQPTQANLRASLKKGCQGLVNSVKLSEISTTPSQSPQGNDSF